MTSPSGSNAKPERYGDFGDSYDAAAWAMLELGRLMSPIAEERWQALDDDSRAHLQAVTAEVLRQSASGEPSHVH